MANNELPDWAQELSSLYESHAANQFILHGNVNDRLLLPLGVQREIGGIDDYLEKILLGPFDVVLSYDLGNGLRVEKGRETYGKWPTAKEGHAFPKKPRDAMERITHYLRYCANLKKVGGGDIRTAVIVRATHLIIPAMPGTANYELNAMASLVRDWANDPTLGAQGAATFLITPNVNDLHHLVITNPRAARIQISLPDASELEGALGFMEKTCPKALSEYKGKLDIPAGQLIGATISSVESLLLQREHHNKPIVDDDLSELKKQLVERDCQGLIEFVEPDRDLGDYVGQDAIVDWLKGDIALWKQGDLQAMPMGYLLCGPVGTGKTYLVECLAGEADVPVVKLKNFRDRWVGSTEGNLEKIFGLLHALGRCIVFIDEADQALGQRNSGSGDSGVSGRVYSMMAKEMSDTRNRGKIVWILASSRPDLIEVDLKRPGRVDVKMPIFPATEEKEAYGLIRALGKKVGVALPKEMPAEFEGKIPGLVTPGAAEALAVKVYRMVKTKGMEETAALLDCLTDYQNPVPEDVMRFQIEIAARESTDLTFIPEKIRDYLFPPKDEEPEL